SSAPPAPAPAPSPAPAAPQPPSRPPGAPPAPRPPDTGHRRGRYRPPPVKVRQHDHRPAPARGGGQPPEPGAQLLWRTRPEAVGGLPPRRLPADPRPRRVLRGARRGHRPQD